MKLKTVNRLRISLQIFTITMALLSVIFPSVRIIFLLLALAGLISSAYIDYQYWRCPYCGEYLGKRTKKGHIECPRCHEPCDGDVFVDAKEAKEKFDSMIEQK